MTVADDGAGIVDPAVLLSFGENGWSEELVQSEDAAGFGFASLSRRGCTVSSRPRPPDGNTMPGWRVTLAPEHFRGEAEAGIHADDAAPLPHGTSISFPATEAAATIRQAAESAARHYPLPVFVEGIPRPNPAPKPRARRTSSKSRSKRRAFLDGAVHAEPWHGLAFGVFRYRHRGYNDPDLNFHGLTLPAGLPAVETIHGGLWSVRADCLPGPDPGPATVPIWNWCFRRGSKPSRTISSRSCAARHGLRSTAPWRPTSVRIRLRRLEAGAECRHRYRATAGGPASLAPGPRPCRRLARAAEARRSGP